MKNLIIVIILGVAGYFGYQYFIGSSQQGSISAEPDPYEYLPFIPDECQSAGKSLEDAVYRDAVSATINGYTKNLRICLRKAGFTESQIDEACDRIKDSR